MIPPYQLPADIADFTGRADLVSEVGDLLTSGVAVVNLAGKAGAGKTTLAVHVAHGLRAFPDGQLFVSMRGTTTNEVLGRFLRALGVPGESIPDTQAERAERYRQLLADQAVLVVLDDATGDIGALLPSVPRCAVLATSRAPLQGAHVVTVGVLDRAEAVELLAARIGPERVAQEPEAARALADSVGGLPLALRIVGARLAARPHWRLGSMVRRLGDERSRLDELVHGDLVVRGSLMVSYDELSPAAARLLGLLGTVRTESLPRWVADAALGRPAGFLVDELAEAQLLDQVGDSRYSFHDLVRIFAREQAGQREQTEALRRVLGGWLRLAELAHRTCYGGDFTTMKGSGARLPVKPDERIATDPLGWLESEKTNICLAIAQAAGAGLDELCWDLAITMVTLFEVRGYYDDWQRTHEIALRATESVGNRRGSAALRSSLTTLHIARNRLDLARATALPALRVFEEIGDLTGLALVCRNLGIIDRRSGAPASARQWYSRAIAAFDQLGDVVGRASMLGILAQVELGDGEYDRALELVEQAALLCGSIANLRIRAQIRFRHGRVLTAVGEHERAHDLLCEALALVREGNDVPGESFVLRSLGSNEMLRGRLTEAKRVLADAISVCERNFDLVGAAVAKMDLARVHHECGEVELAESLAGDAQAVCAEFGMTISPDGAMFTL